MVVLLLLINYIYTSLRITLLLGELQYSEAQMKLESIILCILFTAVSGLFFCLIS
jgi:hypothetical protein